MYSKSWAHAEIMAKRKRPGPSSSSLVLFLVLFHEVSERNGVDPHKITAKTFPKRGRRRRECTCEKGEGGAEVEGEGEGVKGREAAGEEGEGGTEGGKEVKDGT